jgi:hypothetical protein
LDHDPAISQFPLSLGWQACTTMPSLSRLRWDLVNFAQWPWTGILLISVSPEGRITGISHHTQPHFTFFPTPTLTHMRKTSDSELNTHGSQLTNRQNEKHKLHKPATLLVRTLPLDSGIKGHTDKTVHCRLGREDPSNRDGWICKCSHTVAHSAVLKRNGGKTCWTQGPLWNVCYRNFRAKSPALGVPMHQAESPVPKRQLRRWAVVKGRGWSFRQCGHIGWKDKGSVTPRLSSRGWQVLWGFIQKAGRGGVWDIHGSPRGWSRSGQRSLGHDFSSGSARGSGEFVITVFTWGQQSGSHEMTASDWVVILPWGDLFVRHDGLGQWLETFRCLLGDLEWDAVKTSSEIPQWLLSLCCLLWKGMKQVR